tara:strand:- start:4480 stop:5382 length:903 start_codon:yes stop_codon:yes gene_type:complete
MTFIVAIGGKKGSGKTSLSCYISAVINDIVFNESKYVGDLFQLEEDPRSVYRTDKNDVEGYDFYNFKNAINDNLVRTYSFADALKQFLLSSFDVSYDQLYGTDEEKNTITRYSWGTLPAFVRWINSPLKNLSMNRGSDEIIFAKKDFINSIRTEDDFFQAMHWGWIPDGLKYGKMTARELMQILGTDIGRKMFDNDIWVDTTLNKINKEKPSIAIVDDLRFCSEADGILRNNGMVVLLSRNTGLMDIHGSEKDLEKLSINSDNIIYINNDCGINEKNKKCLSSLEDCLKKEIKNDFSQQV